MNTFFEPTYYLQFLYFFLTAFLAFFIPGNVLLSKLKIESRLASITYAFVIGIVFWAIQGYVFGYLGLRNLSYLYLLFFAIFWVKVNWLSFKNFNLKFEFKFQKNYIPVILLLLFGVLIQMFFTFYNGVLTSSGLNFCCQTPDNLYHIGLTQSLVKHMPPYEPAMHEVLVKNYHFLGNLVSAELIRIFKLDLILTQYHYMTFLVSLLLGMSAIAFGKVLKLGNLFISFLLFFIFFAGDITFLLTFLNGKGLNFNYPFLYDATTLWYSPPRVYAFAVMLTGFGLFCIWLKNKSNYLALILSVIFASLIGFKIYNGIGIFAGLLFLSLYFIYKKQFKDLILFASSLLIGLLIYLPINTGASGISWIGFWRVENFISQYGFGLEHLELARRIYVEHNNIPRMIQYEFMYTLFYFIFVFGSLNIAFFQTRKTLNFFPKELNILLISSVFVSLFLGFFTFQKIGGSNTSQFLISFEMIASLYAASVCVYVYRKIGILKFLFVALIILLTVPRVMNKIIVTYGEISQKRNLIISREELEALKFLSSNSPSSSVVFTDNKNLNIDKTCYYVGFLTGRNLFLCNAEGILMDHGVDISTRNQEYKKIYDSLNTSSVINTLSNNKIDYLYLSNKNGLSVYESKDLVKVFENGSVKIIKVGSN